MTQKTTNVVNPDEQAYLDLMKDILDNGTVSEDRTGIGTKSLFGKKLEFDISNGKIPLFTTRKLSKKVFIEELLFFLRGEHDTSTLEAKGVNIWKGNTTREFLDSRGLFHVPEKSMGKSYGHSWRNFGGTDEKKGIDQIANVIESIKKDPLSRRHVVFSYNPSQVDESCLPQCHTNFQFYIRDGKISCAWTQRSVDLALGAAANCPSYATLTHIIAKLTGLKADKLVMFGGDCHIYSNLEEMAKAMISRVPFEFPTITIPEIDLNFNVTHEDFILNNYKCHGPLKGIMAI